MIDHKAAKLYQAMGISDESEVSFNKKLEEAYTNAKMRSEVLEFILNAVNAGELNLVEAIYFSFRFGQRDAGYLKSLDESKTPTVGKSRWDSLELVFREETENNRGLPTKKTQKRKEKNE